VLLLFYRYAEPASAAVDNSSGGGAPNGQSALPQKVPGTTYKTHLHALWRLLSDAEPELLANGGGINMMRFFTSVQNVRQIIADFPFTYN